MTLDDILGINERRGRHGGDLVLAHPTAGVQDGAARSTSV
jgi:hypothetical protein